jgi:hypothetical protein
MNFPRRTGATSLVYHSRRAPDVQIEFPSYGCCGGNGFFELQCADVKSCAAVAEKSKLDLR